LVVLGCKEDRLSQSRCHVPRDIAGRRQDPDSGDYGAGGLRGPDASGFCASILIARSFFVQGAATVAIESDPLEARAVNASHVAGVAELVDAPDLGSGGENRGGSIPSARTKP
jgi:hypothetical protein